MTIAAAEVSDGDTSNDALCLSRSLQVKRQDFAVGDITVAGGALSNFGLLPLLFTQRLSRQAQMERRR